MIAGDQEAFRLLYHEYSDKVYNTALSFTKNIEDAEEVTQDVFTRVYLNASKFKGDSRISTWIYRIAVNTSLTQVQKSKRRNVIGSMESEQYNEPPEWVHPGVILENKEDAIYLYKVLENLPDNQKSAFILTFIDGLPQKEVAKIMESSLKAVESLLQRAKMNMRAKLEKLHPNRRKK